MKSDNIKSINVRIDDALALRRYSQAISQLQAMAAAASAPWEIRREIETLGSEYGYLCRYALDGIVDPERHQQLASIEAKIRRLAVAITRHCDIEDSSRQYFATLRFEKLQPDSSLPVLISRYITARETYVKNSLFADRYVKPEEAHSEAVALESLENRIFNIVWTTFPLTAEHEDSLKAVFADATLTDDFKQLIISALTMGALEYYDERRISMLAELYIDNSQSVSTRIRALCGLLLAVWMHRHIHFGNRLQSTIESIADSREWADDLKMVFMELVRTRDTERIARALSEDVIPQMMKMRPDISKKIQLDEQALETFSPDENPEWAEMIEKSGLGEKLRELNELQADGGDVMMSTMSHLKSFPFFSEIANWFRPFSLQQSDVVSILGDSGVEIGELIDASPLMCDNDKYSIVLSLDRIPRANRRMMLEQFKLQDINLTEIKSTQLNPELTSRRNICNKYVQDLYRFFRLYRRKDDFRNPFAAPVNLASVAILQPYFNDGTTLAAVAEFYFSRGYYDDALNIYNILIDGLETSSPEILQKCGYCLQHKGMIAEALEMYQRSEMLRPDSLWTLRRIAQCHKLLGQSSQALDYYNRILAVRPDDNNVLLNAGHCHVESGNYDEALKLYFKVEYLNPDSGKALRPIAWCAFLTADYDRAKDYCYRILKSNPTSTDYLNIGHLMMATGQYREAANYYLLSRQTASPDTVQNFLRLFNEDRKYLDRAGVDSDIIDIVIDSITH